MNDEAVNTAPDREADPEPRAPAPSTAPTPAGRVRIVDVARLAGVSPMTVSNALNAPHRVREQTLAAVQAAIKQSGYVPNQAARALASGRNRVFGLPIYPPPDGLTEQYAGLAGFMTGLVTELAVAAGRVGHGVQLVSPTPVTTELDLFEQLIAAGQVDALLLTETVPDDPRVNFLTERGFPFAAFGRTPPGHRQCWVDIDNTASMATVTSHLISTGRRRLAYLQSSGVQLPWVRQRRDGFLSELDRNSLSPAAIINVAHLDDIPNLVNAQQSQAAPPDAYVADNDAYAVLAIRALQRLGITVGKDVAVTGFNDFPLAALLETTLTTARIPLADVARRLIARALDEVDNRPDRPGELITAQLIVRASG